MSRKPTLRRRAPSSIMGGEADIWCLVPEAGSRATALIEEAIKETNGDPADLLATVQGASISSGGCRMPRGERRRPSRRRHRSVAYAVSVGAVTVGALFGKFPIEPLLERPTEPSSTV